MDKATLNLLNEPKHNYVGLPVTEMNVVSVGLRHAWFSAVGQFVGRKSKISHEQNVSIFQFYIRLSNFRLVGAIIKKRYLGRADPLNPLNLFQYWISVSNVPNY